MDPEDAALRDQRMAQAQVRHSDPLRHHSAARRARPRNSSRRWQLRHQGDRDATRREASTSRASLRAAPTGNPSARRISSFRSAAGSARKSFTKPIESAPQKSSPSTSKVGTPNTPRATASSVFFLQCVLHLRCIRDLPSFTSRSFNRTPKRAGSDASAPVVQTASKMRPHGLRRRAAAIARRRWCSGIERVRSGEAERDAEALRPPVAPAVGLAALRRQSPPAPSAPSG